MKFDDTVGFILYKLNIAHRNALQRSVAEVGLNSGQVFLLFELWKLDGQRQIDLANNVHLAAPTVNKMINRLVEAGLLTNEKYEDDGRSTRVFLTERGYQIREEIELQWIDLEAQTLTRLTETEGMLLKQLLQKMLGHDDEDE